MRFSQDQVVRKYKPLKVIYFCGKHDSRRRHCTMGFIIFQSREGSISFNNKLKISVLAFLLKKVQAFRGVYFVRIREKPLRWNLCSRNRPGSRSHSRPRTWIQRSLVWTRRYNTRGTKIEAFTPDQKLTEALTVIHRDTFSKLISVVALSTVAVTFITLFILFAITFVWGWRVKKIVGAVNIIKRYLNDALLHEFAAHFGVYRAKLCAEKTLAFGNVYFG